MKNIRFLCLTLVGLVVLGPAVSADPGTPVSGNAATMATPAPYNWGGFYFGANFGGGWGSTNYWGNNILGGAPAGNFASHFNSSGIFGGGQVGFNYQLPNAWLIGVEADLDGAGIDGPSSGCPASAAGVVSGCSSSISRGDRFGTVRARLGYTWNDLLLYGTGGWAWGHVTTTTTLSCAGPGCPAVNAVPSLSGVTASASATLPGSVSWVAGAGGEWGFRPNWTLRLEYLHLQFDGAIENFTFVGGPATLGSHIRTNNSVDTLRVGVNFLFN